MSNTQKKNVPKLRFPGFEGEWEEKQFADFTKINQGLQIAINERKTEYSPELYFYITNEFL
ncbi:TPA: restriction endonuclease subunit S, partial [Staphylococcus aureus]|nr:restriction endonuclease subunit S [Staphylococcus aureus]